MSNADHSPAGPLTGREKLLRSKRGRNVTGKGAFIIAPYPMPTREQADHTATSVTDDTPLR